jgi:hypothetical protein
MREVVLLGELSERSSGLVEGEPFLTPNMNDGQKAGCKGKTWRMGESPRESERGLSLLECLIYVS